MTDDLKAAEDAARAFLREIGDDHQRTVSFEETLATEDTRAWRAVDWYRAGWNHGSEYGYDRGYQAGDSDTDDAIIARRDAEVAELVEAAREVVVLEHAGFFGSNVTPEENALIADRARRFGAALKPFTKEAGQ